MNCLNWLSRRYRLLQTGCKQLSPYLQGVSHLYCTHFQIYQRHLWLIFFKILIICLNWLSRWYRRAVNSYRPTYPGVKSILHTFSILSAPSMIEFFKTLKNCLNWLSIWYRFIQTGCKQLSPCLSAGVSRLAANIYRLMARLSQIILCIIQYNV